MIDWYKEYDRATFMKDFASIEFRKFDPYYKLEKGEDSAAEMGQLGESGALPESIFDDSNAFSQMFFQFNLQVREQINIRKIQDPFSQNCMTYARQACLLMTRELMQAHLIVTSNEVEPGDVQKSHQSLKKREVINKFKQHCMHLVSWGHTELFYIFTVCNLVQTNDTAKFFRERVLQIALRILHAEVYLWKYIVNADHQDIIKQFVELIQGRIEYKFDLTQALMTKIRHFELVNPIEVETLSNIHKLQSGIINNEKEAFDVEEFLSQFRDFFFQLFEEMRSEPIQQIKEELRVDKKLDLDQILRKQFNQNGFEYGEGENRIMIQESMLDTHSNGRPRQGSPDDTQANQTHHFSDNHDVFDETKSARTNMSKKNKSNKNIVGSLKLIHQNVLKEKFEIDQVVDDDTNIDLAKIRKTFKNLINDQRFQQNYEKIIKNGNPQILNAKDRNNFEKRKQQITAAKTIFTEQVQKKPRFHLQNILDNLRKNLDQENALQHTQAETETAVKSSYQSLNNSDNNVEQNLNRGTFRKKQGVIKNERQMPFYYDNSSSRQKELPRDLVDYYLQQRFKIVLGNSKKTNALESNSGGEGSSDLQTTADSAFEKPQEKTNNIESRAKILENPMYQKMPFYPYKDLLMWQEVEKQRTINSGTKRNDMIFQQVRIAYKQLVKENVSSFLKRNPRDEKAKKLLKRSDSPSIYLKALFGDIVSQNDLEMLKNDLRKDLDNEIQPDQRKQGHMRHSPDEKTHSKQDHMSFDPDEEQRKYIEAAMRALDEYDRGKSLQSTSLGGDHYRTQSNDFDSFTKQNQMQSRMDKGSIVHSIQDSRIWSDDLGGLGESRQYDDDHTNVSMSKIYLGGGGVNDTTQQVINQNMQGVADSQTVSFVENLSDQFEQLFNLDQIQDAKLHDGVNKRSRANPGKYGGTVGGDMNSLFGLRETDQKDLATDRRPIRIKDVATNGNY